MDAAFIPEEVLHAVRTGACEIGLLGAPAVSRAADLHVLPIEDQRFVLVTAPGGPFTGRDRIRPKDLAGHRLVASQRGSLMRAMVDDVLSTGVTAKIVAEVAHRTSILPLVLAGVGDAILPAGWTGTARRAGCEVLPVDSTLSLRVALVYRKTPLTPAAQAFLESAKRYAAEKRFHYRSVTVRNRKRTHACPLSDRTHRFRLSGSSNVGLGRGTPGYGLMRWRLIQAAVILHRGNLKIRVTVEPSGE